MSATMEEPQVEARTKAEVEAEKNERFRRVASGRANKALGFIELLLRTSDTSNYHYTPEQADEVVGKLRGAVDQLDAAYTGSSKVKLRVEL